MSLSLAHTGACTYEANSDWEIRLCPGSLCMEAVGMDACSAWVRMLAIDVSRRKL